MSRHPFRILLAISMAVLAVSACAGTQTGQPGPTDVGSRAPGAEPTAGNQGAGDGGGTSLVEAAAAVTNACTLLPADLAAAIVPDGSAPVEEQFPPRCSVFGSKTAMAFSIGAYDTGGRQAPSDSESVPGLGIAAWIQHLSPGNFSLTVLLAPDAGSLYAEVNNQDGKDHRDEVVNLARAVLAKLK